MTVVCEVWIYMLKILKIHCGVLTTCGTVGYFFNEQVPILSVSHALLACTWGHTCTSYAKQSLHERHKLELLMTLKTARRAGVWRAAVLWACESWYLIWISTHCLYSESDGGTADSDPWDLLRCNEVHQYVCVHLCVSQLGSVWVILRRAAQVESSY